MIIPLHKSACQRKFVFPNFLQPRSWWLNVSKNLHRHLNCYTASVLVIFLKIIFLILFIRQIIIFLISWWTGITTDVPFKASEQLIINRLKKYLQQCPAQTFLELGSGSGRVSLALAKKFPIKIIAIEKNKFLFYLAKFKHFFAGKLQGNITWLNINLFKHNLNNYDVIYLYLSPAVNKKIAAKLARQLSKNARAITFKFKLNHPQFELVQTIGKRLPLYIYQKK